MRLIGIGLVAGFFSALFGVGGGLVAVPLLIMVAAFPPHAATATSLGAIGITALAGTILYAVQGGHVEVGLRAARRASRRRRRGARHGLQQRISGRALALAFAAFLAGVALWLLLSAPAEVDATGVGDAGAWRIAAALGLGLAAGTLAGLFGIGGGLLFVPTLIWLGLGQLEAEATSLLAILPTVAAGAWRQHRYGNLRHRAALVLGLSSVAGRRGRRPRREGAARGHPAVALRGADAPRRRAARVALAVTRDPIFQGSLYASAMAEHDEIWLPLVDEPIGTIVAQIQADDPEIERLVGSPRRILAFRTFAYIRVGVKLGELLVEHDVPPYDGTESWIELLLRDPAHRAAVAARGAGGGRGDRGGPALRRGGAARARRGCPRPVP